MTADVRGRARGWRLLSIVAIVLGLLAMHGLASSHHASAPLTEPQAAAADVAHGVMTMTDHAVTAAAELAPGVDAGCSGTCEQGLGLAALCVAVLVAAAAALLPGVRAAPLHGVDRRPASAPVRPRRTRPPRTPDPVTELCTSRT